MCTILCTEAKDSQDDRHTYTQGGQARCAKMKAVVTVFHCSECLHRSAPRTLLFSVPRLSGDDDYILDLTELF